MDTINKVLAESAHNYFTSTNENYKHDTVLTDLLRDVLKAKQDLKNECSEVKKVNNANSAGVNSNLSIDTIGREGPMIDTNSCSSVSPPSSVKSVTNYTQPKLKKPIEFEFNLKGDLPNEITKLLLQNKQLFKNTKTDAENKNDQFLTDSYDQIKQISNILQILNSELVSPDLLKPVIKQNLAKKAPSKPKPDLPKNSQQCSSAISSISSRNPSEEFASNPNSPSSNSVNSESYTDLKFSNSSPLSVKSVHVSGETGEFYRDISSRFNPSVDKIRELLIPITENNKFIKTQDSKNSTSNPQLSFPCQKCDLKFTQCSSLKRHEKTIHDNRKDYECGVCKKKFGEPGNLQKHIKTVHEKRYSCGFEGCQKKFGQAASLRRHTRLVHEKVQNSNEKKSKTVPKSVVNGQENAEDKQVISATIIEEMNKNTQSTNFSESAWAETLLRTLKELNYTQ